MEFWQRKLTFRSVYMCPYARTRALLSLHYTSSCPSSILCAASLTLVDTPGETFDYKIDALYSVACSLPREEDNS